MRVLIATGLYPPDIGGPATYSHLLSAELPKMGWEVDILTFGSVRYLPKIIRHFVYFLKVLKRGRRADIIFAQDPVSVGLPSALGAKILAKRFILKIVGDYAWEQGIGRFGVEDLLDDFQFKKYGQKIEFLRRIQKWVGRQADKIIVPSQYLKKIVAGWGISEEKINVIYNAAEQSICTHSSLSDRHLILSIGRLVPWKGFGLLIELISELSTEIQLMIIGSGQEEENLKKKIEKLQLTERVKLLKPVPHEQLTIYFSQAKIFVLNTAYEGFSHVILEAMQQGVPVITTEIGGNSEIIENNYNGILVEYNNRQQFKEAILKLWFDEYLQKKFINNSFKVLEKFTLEKMVSQTLKLLVR